MGLLRGTIWTINFLLVGAIAYAAAVTTSLVLDQRLRVEPNAPTMAGVAGERAAPRVVRPISDFQVLLDRNIFNAERKARPKPKAAQPLGRKSPVQQAPELPPLEVALTGTFIAGDNSDNSFAMISGADGKEEQVYRIGDCLPRGDGATGGETTGKKCSPEQARLVGVALGHVTVLRGGKKSDIEISERILKPASRSKPARTRSQPNTSRRDKIKKRTLTRSNLISRAKNPTAASANTFPMTQSGNVYEYTVPTAEVEQAFENFTDIIRQGRVVPKIVDGQARGFEIRKIQPGSIFQKLGLRNNDVIRSVNGQSITSADQALRLFTVFRNEREIVLDIERANNEIQLSYTVQ